MTQIFAQHSLPSAIHVLAPGATCEIRVEVPTIVRYSVATGTAPAPDTIPDGTIATTIVDPAGTEVSGHIIDSGYVWLVVGVAGTTTLRLIREADADSLDDWLPAGSLWYTACWIAGARPTPDRQQS